MKQLMNRLWLAAVLTLCAGATASAYDLTVAASEHGAVTFLVDGTEAAAAEAGQTVTIVVTPDEGFSADDFTVEVYAKWSEAQARRRAPGTSQVEVGGDLTFQMPEAHVEVFVTYKETSGIARVATKATPLGTWYTLGGRRLSGKPTMRGVYIHDGKKVCIR